VGNKPTLYFNNEKDMVIMDPLLYELLFSDKPLMSHVVPFRILAVDPATTKSGWAVLDVTSLQPLNIKIVATSQIDGKLLLKTKKEMNQHFTDQFCVLDALASEYHDLIEFYGPDYVVSEGAFAHAHAAAAVALTLAINILRQTCHKLLGKDIVVIPPTVSKMAFTGSGAADRDHMRLAYQTNAYLDGVVADDKITEHEIDATAHGVAMVFVHILKTVIQISAKERRRAKLEKKKLKELKALEASR
jgi:Holliday junction resolvasome RuvABC endonuclease subunit